MSRSQPTPTNPAKRFFQWKGDRGDLVYYDKEQKKEIAMDIPFEFMVLDQLSTITGFCEPDESSYWSNEVRSTKKQPFTVKTSKGVKETGLYENLTDVRSKGAKYAKSIYIAFKENEEEGYVIGNLKAVGACLSAYIDLSNSVAIMNGKVRLTGSTEGKKGRTVYQIPTFEWDHTDSDEDEIAVELDKQLQVYLKQYFDTPEEIAPEDNSFELTEAESARLAARKKDVVIEDIPEKVDLSEVPDFKDPPMPPEFLNGED